MGSAGSHAPKLLCLGSAAVVPQAQQAACLFRLVVWLSTGSDGFRLVLSTGERPLVDTIADRRYWLIHLLTVPSLFPARFTSVLAGLSAVTLQGVSHATNEILNNRF